MTTQFKDVAHLYLDYKTQVFPSDTSEDTYTPILRPLSDITDEEVIEIIPLLTQTYEYNKFKISYRGKGFDKYGHEIDESVLCIEVQIYQNHPSVNDYVPYILLQIDLEEGDFIFSAFSNNGKEIEDEMIYRPFDFMTLLLSKHFDLHGLIESRQAIDATTLNPNPYKQ